METLLLIFLFALGACVGSFLNVVIHRLPRGESIVFPGSHCPACGRAIRWYDNIPLLSWLVLRGRCRDCKASISPRYLAVEAATAVLVAGLFLWFYVLDLRSGTGTFLDTWPAYAAHAGLFCALLASSLVDIESWLIPLEVCWVATLLGLVCATADPPGAGLLPRVSPETGAACVGAVAGLALAMLLVHYGYLQRSFLDAEDRPLLSPPEDGEGDGAASAREAESVGFTSAHGVNPRGEILREVAFLAPAAVLAVAAAVAVSRWQPVREAWLSLLAPGAPAARHLNGLLAALCGYLVGGLWIWGVRIGGTLAFGREAMGLGDVHILAAVGAVCGWIVPSMAFFLAAFLGLAWAVAVFLFRRQRELPYGPWLAGGGLLAVLFHDRLLGLLGPYMDALRILFGEGSGL